MSKLPKGISSVFVHALRWKPKNMLWRPSTGQLPNIDLFEVSNRNTRKKVWNLFKVNGKDTRTTSLTLDVENIGLGRLRIFKFGFLSNHFYYVLKDQYFQYSMLLPFFCCLNFELILHLVFSSRLWVFYVCWFLPFFEILWSDVKNNVDPDYLVY